MSLTSRQLQELENLLAELADDRLSDRARADLEAMLRSEPEARDRYIEFMSLCSDLHEMAGAALSAGDNLGDVGVGEGGRGNGADRSGWPTWHLWGVPAAGLMTLAALLAAVLWLREPRPNGADEGPLVGRWQAIDGLVEVGSPRAVPREASPGDEVRGGQEIAVQGQDSQGTIRLEDGSVIHLAGDTRLRWSAVDPERIEIDLGNITASVRPRLPGRPLVVASREARIDVLGTRLSVSRDARRTNVGVVEGEVRVTRLSDERTVVLGSGQMADASSESDLKPRSIQPPPDTWTLDFDGRLPAAWKLGQLVFDDPSGEFPAAVRAAPVDRNGQRRYGIKSENAWSDGLFTLHDDTWIHIRYRLETAGSFLLYLVCRQQDFGQPVATVLTRDNIKQKVAGAWQTLSLPAKELYRTKTRDSVPLEGQLVCFLVVFDSPSQNPGLTVGRIRVTRGNPPGEGRSVNEGTSNRPDGAAAAGATDGNGGLEPIAEPHDGRGTRLTSADLG